MPRNTYSYQKRTKIKFFFLSLLAFLLIGQVQSVTSCTVITTQSDNSVWFGYNEDRIISQFNQRTYVKFHEATNLSYGYMEVTAEAPGIFSLRVGVNEFGVVISGNSVDSTVINDHPEKIYSWQYESIYKLILQKCTNVSEAINLVQNFNFRSPMAFQFHVTDKNGDAIVASPGLNHEIAIVEKKSNFLISTNANREFIEKGGEDFRNEVAEKTLEKYVVLEKEALTESLRNVHVNSFEGCTYYSVIFNLNSGMAYFYLMHDFNTEYSINVTEQLLNKDSTYLLTSFFPNGQQILDNAKAGMVFQEQLVTGIRILTLLSFIVIIGHFIFGLFKTKRSRMNWKSKISYSFTSLILHFYLILLFLFSSAFLPAILFMGFLENMLFSLVFPIEIFIWILLIGVGILMLGYKLLNGKKTDVQIV